MWFFSIAYDSTKKIATGDFLCPHCATESNFSHCRNVRKRINVFFLPFGGVEEILGEYVVCKSCNTHMEASVLLDACPTDQHTPDSSLRNVVTFSEEATLEITRRMRDADFEAGTYVRIIPAEAGSTCDVKFDIPYADDREWLGRSRGLSIVIDRDLAELVLGMEIDFDGQEFCTRAVTST